MFLTFHRYRPEKLFVTDKYLIVTLQRLNMPGGSFTFAMKERIAEGELFAVCSVSVPLLYELTVA